MARCSWRRPPSRSRPGGWWEDCCPRLPDENGIAWLLTDDGLAHARQLGLLVRLAFGITGSLTGVLPHARLQLGKDALSLEIPIAKKALAAEPVHKRLAAAADTLGKRPQILFI